MLYVEERKIVRLRKLCKSLVGQKLTPTYLEVAAQLSRSLRDERRSGKSDPELPPLPPLPTPQFHLRNYLMNETHIFLK